MITELLKHEKHRLSNATVGLYNVKAMLSIGWFVCLNSADFSEVLSHF